MIGEVARSAVVAIVAILAAASPAMSRQSDSADAKRLPVAAEFRLDMSDAFVRPEVEFEYLWRGILGMHLSSGVGVRYSYTSFTAGVSVVPLPFLFGEADIGFASWEETVIDAPSFSPDYVTRLRGGVLLPLGGTATRFFVSMSGARTTLVDNSFGGGGFFPPGSDQLPRSQKAVRTFTTFLLGLKMRI